MLPYLPRQSNRKLKTDEAQVDQITEGGPFQRALVQDLKALRPALPTPPSFAACKLLFQQSKLAAWHSRLLPPKVDRCAWSQLIYASCLSLLPAPPPSQSAEAASSSTNATLLTDAAFAIFSLYILHETNPLPRNIATTGGAVGSQQQLIPMGIRPQYEHNLSRRYFRPYIRIDTTTFTHLLYWREVARATSSTSNDNHNDMGAVLERLWGQFDFCSYTGPRGVEGLAQHADYPYNKSQPDEQPNKMNHRQNTTTTKTSSSRTDKNTEPIHNDTSNIHQTEAASIATTAPTNTGNGNAEDGTTATTSPCAPKNNGSDINHNGGTTSIRESSDTAVNDDNDNTSASQLPPTAPEIDSHKTNHSTDRSAVARKNDLPSSSDEDEEDDDKEDSVEYPNNEKALAEQIKDYVACRQSIRIPPPTDERHKRKLDRLRATLQPLYTEGPSSIQALITKVQEQPHATTTVLQSRPRMVTFSVVESVFDGGQSVIFPPEDATVASDTRGTGNSVLEETATHELVLPLGTPTLLRQSLEQAVESLLNGDSCFELPMVTVPGDGDDVSTLAPSVGPETNNSKRRGAMLAKDKSANNGSSLHIPRRKPRSSLVLPGVDTLQKILDEAESTTGSAYSQAGRQALQTLLDEAKRAQDPTARLQSNSRQSARQTRQVGQTNTGDGTTGSAISHAGGDALQTLLAQVPAASRNNGHIADDGASVISHAGRDALQTLLAQETRNTVDATAAGGAGDDNGSVVSHVGRDALQTLLAQVTVDVDDGTSVVSHVGRDAIQHLLDQVQQTNRDDDSKPQARSVPIQKGQDFLTGVDNPATAVLPPIDEDLSDFSGDEAEEDDFSEAVSSLGRKALKELIDSAPTKPKGRIRKQLKREVDRNLGLLPHKKRKRTIDKARDDEA